MEEGTVEFRGKISGLYFFRATQKEVAICILADYGLTGHRIGEKKSALRVPTI